MLWCVYGELTAQSNPPPSLQPITALLVLDGKRTILKSSPDLNISTTIGWIVIRFGSDIPGLQMINPPDFDDPMTEADVLVKYPQWSNPYKH